MLAPLASAAIDVSDGLAADLGHMMTASGTGAEIDLRRLPVSAVYREMFAAVGWEAALAFGDDYELCFTLPPARAQEIAELAGGFACGIHHIGDVVAASGIHWTDGCAPYVPTARGFNHFG